MGWIPRVVNMAIVGLTLFAAIGSIPATAKAGDFAVLGISSTTADGEIEADDLLGDWKDVSWRRVVWRVEASPDREDLRLTYFGDNGSTARFRGVVVHVSGKGAYLDLTSEAVNATVAAPHVILKLKRERVNAFSIGTPRRVRREFDGKLAKSFDRLILIPPRATGLRELPESPSVLSGSLPGEPTKAAAIAATRVEVAELLKKHAGTSGLWKGEADGITVAHRRTLNDPAAHP